MDKPTSCTIGDCTRKVQARGMCGSHYGAWHRKQHGRKDRQYERTCVVCGTTWRTRRRVAKFCSDACKGFAYSETKRTRCPLPSHHPVIVELQRQRDERERLARSAAEAARAARVAAWRTERECPGCGCIFVPLHTPTMLHCSRRCVKRVERRKRRLSDRHIGWVWSEFMQIAARFDYCCAYCGVKPPRLDPDHVVPLSRGGADSTTNLLPACPMCNSSKCARTLSEWTQWRAVRGLPVRVTTWTEGDPRYTHLTHSLLAA